MATELYGSYASLEQSQGATPVSTDTVLIGIGSCVGGELNHAYVISSLSDYGDQLNGNIGDGHNLTDLAIAAFQIAGISKVVMIPVSHSSEFVQADYLGSASLNTGVYALEDYLRDNPSTTNLVVLPNVTDSAVLTALDGVCKLADGHWRSFFVYDLPQSADHINASNIAVPSEIIEDKSISSEYSRAVWGSVLTSGGHVVSGAAVQACLMALSDAAYKAPARSGGNLAVSGILSPCIEFEQTNTYQSYGLISVGTGDANPKKLETASDVYVPWNDNAVYSVNDDGLTVVEYDDCVALRKAGTGSYSGIPTVTESINTIENVKIPQKSIGNQLSADGVCSWVHYGGGNYHTWGDHTAAFTNGNISDERARFDNTIRVLCMIINRFQLKYRFSIDNPMDLGMRNDIIDEEQTFLNLLVSNRVLIGNPTVEFKLIENSQDDLQRGEFTFSIAATPTIPAKYLNAKVSYTSAGLSVYVQNVA